MANVSVDVEELVHLLRAGLAPDHRQFESLSRRIVRRLRRDYGETVDALVATLEDGRSQNSTTRAAMSQLPHTSSSDAERFLIAPRETGDVPVLRGAASKQVNRLLLEQNSLDRLAEAGLSASRTALFVGPPGVGKTMTARWIASELRRPFFVLNLASVMSSRLGQSGTNVRDAMVYARESKAVLLLDEFDAVAKRRDDDDIGEAKRIVTVLLQEIDGWPNDALLLAATNHGELLDRAVWRRFDSVIDFPLAGYEEAAATAEIEFGDGVDKRFIELTAKIYQGKPFSEIVNFCNSIKKSSVLTNTSFEDAFALQICDMPQPSAVRVQKEIARYMLDIGFSQRQTSRVSGMARETLRKLKVE